MRSSEPNEIITGAETGITAEERLLLEQLRRGDADAGRRFVDSHYPSIFRYLLSLTRRRELAEDLTQETFLQAWRHLDRFEPRAPVRHWLYRIAHRQFLMALRRRQSETMDEAADVAVPGRDDWTDAVELRELIGTLPADERDVVLLHYLEGYSSVEIARIVQAPEGTVRYRLSQARDRLRQRLGEDDLAYLNEALAPMRQWAWLPLEQMRGLEGSWRLSSPAE